MRMDSIFKFTHGVFIDKVRVPVNWKPAKWSSIFLLKDWKWI